jgi:hypothetical protein
MRIRGEVVLEDSSLWIGEAFFYPEHRKRLETLCDRFRAIGGDQLRAAELVLEALEARLEVLEAVNKHGEV